MSMEQWHSATKRCESCCSHELANSPCVFCSVTAVMAEAPKTPRAANVFRSAWMPAPPPESEPAMVSTRGTCSANLASESQKFQGA